MALDWIKMRTDIYRDPKVIIIADHLMREDSELCRAVSRATGRDMSATRNVIRHAVVGALVSVWGVLRQQGARVDDDLFVRGSTEHTIDDIADLPGLGEAMKAIGWVTTSAKGISFPEFFNEHNTDPAETRRAKNTERQRLIREKKEARQSRDTKRDKSATESATVAPMSRTEKEREIEKEKKKPPTPLSGEVSTDSETGNSQPLGAPSPFTLDRNQPAPFGLDHDAFDRTDWVQIEAAFLARWNSRDGVVSTRDKFIPHKLVREFHDRACEPGWLVAAEQALAKFPLKCLTGGMRLATFFDAETVSAILAGNYDFDPATRGPRKPSGEEKDKESGVIEAEQRKHVERVKADKAKSELAKEKTERLRAKWLAQSSILTPDEIAELASKHPGLQIPVWQERAFRPTGHAVQKRVFQRSYENALCEALELDRGLTPNEAELVNF